MSLVLVVDDSPTEVHLLRQYLERSPVEPTTPEDPGVRFEPFN